MEQTELRILNLEARLKDAYNMLYEHDKKIREMKKNYSHK